MADARDTAWRAPHENKTLSQKILKQLKRNWALYLFVLPPIAYAIVFSYVPLYGIQLAFKQFSAANGIWGSRWVGFAHFERFFASYHFWALIKNTLTLSLYSLTLNFPMPILLALTLHYAINPRFKKFTQTVTYAPYFISVVVLVGMINVFLSPNGPVNQILALFGQKQPTLFMGRAPFFKHIFVLSGVWKQTGWSSIIYIATLAGVSPEHHEAAIVDGANKLQRVRYIDLPGILPTAVILLIMSVGQLMSVGFEKAFLLQNDINIEASEIISTYVYKVGLQNAQYSYSTAIGLFNNIINFILLVSVNRIAKAISGSSLW